MRVRILDAAAQDLIDGFAFYEKQGEGLGTYFLDSLFSDIDSLSVHAGIHGKCFDIYQRMLSNGFPLPFTTEWWRMPRSYTQSWIVGAARHGQENG